jgi:hypothetical protein
MNESIAEAHNFGPGNLWIERPFRSRHASRCFTADFYKTNERQIEQAIRIDVLFNEAAASLPRKAVLLKPPQKKTLAFNGASSLVSGAGVLIKG